MIKPHGMTVTERINEVSYRTIKIKERVQGTVDASTLQHVTTEVEALIAQLQIACADLAAGVAENLETRGRTVDAERRADTLFQLAPTPCVEVDAQGLVVDINPAAAQVLNIAVRSGLGRSFTLFLGGERLGFLSLISSVLETLADAQCRAVIRPKEMSAFPATLSVRYLSPTAAMVLVERDAPPTRHDQPDAPGR